MLLKTRIIVCWCLLGAAALATGCGKREEAAPPARTNPRVEFTHPERRTIERTVGQPGFIDAYEQTSIYPKLPAYIQKWYVDIGDRIQRDQVMADLFVPELDAEFEQKKAQVAQDTVAIEAARQFVKVSEHNLAVATAGVQKAKADLGTYQSAVDRWESEVTRLTGLVAQKVVDRQILDESQKQLKSNVASREGAQAAIEAAQAVELARRSDLDKARVDVNVAEAKAKVSEADMQRYAALVSYTKLTAPYDGVVVVRNANTGDFVQPASGDRSAPSGMADLSVGRGAPIYIVARTDLVRVYVDVPELDADHIQVGTEATIRVQALDDAEINGKVTRTSWSLNVQTRTLRAEIDLPNPEARLLPGMYAYGFLKVHRADVMAVPLAAVVELGNEHYVYLLENGKAVKTAVQAGVHDAVWIEVAKKRVGDQWLPLAGNEQVLVGNLSQLVDGQKVEATPAASFDGQSH